MEHQSIVARFVCQTNLPICLAGEPSSMLRLCATGTNQCSRIVTPPAEYAIL